MKGSAHNLLAPTDAINVEDGGSKYSGSVNALHKAGVELNNPELKDNSQRPVWKAKQQLLGLLTVRYRTRMARYKEHVFRSGVGFLLV